jgi:hypothetical protein
MVVIAEAPWTWDIARDPEQMAFQYQEKYGANFTSFLIPQPAIDVLGDVRDGPTPVPAAFRRFPISRDFSDR